MVVHFCNHYLDYLKKQKVDDDKKDDKPAPKNLDNKNKNKEKEKKMQEKIKEQEDILAALKKIKDSLKDYVLKNKEIAFLRNLFTHVNPLLSNDILNPKCILKKEYSMKIIKASKDDAIFYIKECGKGPMKLKFYKDPTHSNSTECGENLNKTRSEDVKLKPVPKNPQDPSPIDPNNKDNDDKDKDKDDNKDKDKWKLPIDDRSLYLDDGDFYNIMKKDLIESYKNRDRNITVPRSIPKLPYKNPTPAPKPKNETQKEKKEEVVSEEDELVIPIENRNPGVIKKDDEMAIKKIVIDNRIPKRPKVEQKVIIPNPKYIDYPEYNNFTQIMNPKK